MKISDVRLRQIIQEELTIGDLRAALAAAKKAGNIERAKEVAKTAGKKGVKAVLGLIPGAGTIMGVIEAGMEIKDFIDAAQNVDPKVKKKNPLWDQLTVDPNVTAIIDDEVESKFVKTLGDQIAGQPDNTPLPNADVLLNRWLAGKYSGTQITREGRVPVSKQELRQLVRGLISEQVEAARRQRGARR